MIYLFQGCLVFAAALLVLACGTRGTGEAPSVAEGPAAGHPTPSRTPRCVRWPDKTGRRAIAVHNGEVCLGPAPDRALSRDEKEQLLGLAFGQLLGSPPYLDSKAARCPAGGDTQADLFLSNIAVGEGDGRKMWFGEGDVELKRRYISDGKPRSFILRSSVSASGCDVAVFELLVRFKTAVGEALALFDRRSTFTAVFERTEEEWKYEYSFGLDTDANNRGALCRRIGEIKSQYIHCYVW